MELINSLWKVGDSFSYFEKHRKRGIYSISPCQTYECGVISRQHTARSALVTKGSSNWWHKVQTAPFSPKISDLLIQVTATREEGGYKTLLPPLDSVLYGRREKSINIPFVICSGILSKIREYIDNSPNICCNKLRKRRFGKLETERKKERKQMKERGREPRHSVKCLGGNKVGN